MRFAPTGAPAMSYNQAAHAVPHSPLGDAVIAAVDDASARARVPAPLADARLFRFCTELAEMVPEDGSLDYIIVDFALQYHGIIESAPQLLIVWGPLDSPREIVHELGRRLDALVARAETARVGVGAARRHPDGTGAVVFALLGSGISTLPIPRVLPAGGAAVIDAVLDPSYRDPEVTVLRENGETQRVVLDAGRPHGFIATLACGTAVERLRIEIMAHGALGGTSLASFSVWCVADAPRSVTVDRRLDPPVTDARTAERLIFADVNRARSAAGLSVLVWDEAVSQVARGHSNEMLRMHVVTHVSGAGSTIDRLRAANITSTLDGENLALTYSAGELRDALANRPSYRAGAMSREARSVGIGVAFGDGVSGKREMYVTQVFTHVLPKIDAAQAVAVVHQKLDAAIPALNHRPDLTELAQQLADELSIGMQAEQVEGTIGDWRDRLRRSYRRIGYVSVPVMSVDLFDASRALGNVVTAHVGIGLAQGMHRSIGDNALWIVVVFASP